MLLPPRAAAPATPGARRRAQARLALRASAGIILASVAITAGAEATPDSLLVEECLADGRVEWLTITAAATEH